MEGLGGESKEGAAAPSLVVVGGGFLRGRGNRNTLPLKRAFAYFSHEGKVGRGPGVKPPKTRGVGPEAPQGGESQSSPLCKNKTRLCLHKETKARRPLRYHSSCPGTPGRSSLWGNGHRRAGLPRRGSDPPRRFSRLLQGDLPPPVLSALPPKRAALCAGRKRGTRPFPRSSP